MKVGTDAILLAVWCDVSNAKLILDIGTGSGVIALLMAARSNANIDAVELDNQSANEATENFKRSQYNNRLNIFNKDFIDFMHTSKKKYDLIISNPPFFSNDLLPQNQLRKAARHINELTHHMLCKGAKKFLTKDGKFYIVLPVNLSSEFIKIAQSYGLHLYRELLISAKPNTNPNRVNLEFRFEKRLNIIIEKITVRNENGLHSDQYKDLTCDFLMKYD